MRQGSRGVEGRGQGFHAQRPLGMGADLSFQPWHRLSNRAPSHKIRQGIGSKSLKSSHLFENMIHNYYDDRTWTVAIKRHTK